MPIIFTNEPSSANGGIQRYVARLALSYGELGRSVVLIEPKSASSRPAILGVTYRRFFAKPRLIAVVSALLAYLTELRRSVRQATIASIWFPAGLIAALVPRSMRGPLAILAHGTEIAPRRGGLRRSLMRWTYARADAVIANSQSTRQLLRDAGVARPIDVVHCGIDVRALRRTPSDVPTFLSVGRLVARKGFDRTIEAMPALLRALPEARYRIVGDGPQRPYLEWLAADLGVAAHVDFLGAVDDGTLDDEYARAWCFAMPCRRIKDDIEGFGIVYLEAAMAGLASIGGRGSGAEDAIADGDSGALVDGNDPAAIAQILIEMLSDRGRTLTVGARARERAIADFCWRDKAVMIERALEPA